MLFLQVVPLWRQRAGRDEEKLVIWDYHVILIYKPDERCLVFDLDSDLPFPTYFHKYVTETLDVPMPSYRKSRWDQLEPPCCDRSAVESEGTSRKRLGD